MDRLAQVQEASLQKTQSQGRQQADRCFQMAVSAGREARQLEVKVQQEAVIVRRLAGVWGLRWVPQKGFRLLPAPLVPQGRVWALAERSPALHTRYTRHISISFLDLQIAKDNHPRIN